MFGMLLNKINNIYLAKLKGKIFVPTFILIAFIYISSALLINTHPIGESDDYMLPTISISYHLTDDITDDDLKRAHRYYPEHSWYWDAWQNGKFSINHPSGKRYTFYFPTYSVAIIPFVVALKLLHLKCSYAFPLGNAIYFLIALFFLVKIPLNSIIKWSLFTILAFGPTMFYITWPSAEVLITSLCIYSLVALFCQKFKTSLFFMSLATTLNITLTPICLFIWFKYAIHKEPSFYKIDKIKKVSTQNIKEISQLTLIQLITFIPIALNLFRWNRMVVMQGMGTTEGLFGRLIAYLTDLNFGIFPYFPFLLFIVIGVIIFSEKRKEYFVFLLCSFVTLIGISLMVHINCGMTGIARYNLWFSSILLVVSCYYSTFCNKKSLKITQGLTLLSAAYISIFVWACHGIIADRGTAYTWMNPIAKRILYYIPQLYNPLFSTFNNRTIHVDGGYNYQTPVIYVSDKDHYVKKILASKKDKEILKEQLIPLSDKDREKIISELENLSDTDSYLNFDKRFSIKLAN